MQTQAKQDHFADLVSDQPFTEDREEKAIISTVIYEEVCKDCGGTGLYRGPSRFGSACFKCGGAGKLVFKTSPEYRAEQRRKSSERKVKNREALEQKRRERLSVAIAVMVQHYPAEVEWLKRNLATSSFASSVHDGSLMTYGSLSEGQLAAIRQNIQRDAIRQAEARERVDNAKAVNIAEIERIFAVAKERHFASPTLRLDIFKFKPAPAHGKNPGAVYVTISETDEYIGKVAGGKLIGTRRMTPDLEKKVIDVATHPERAAINYGKMSGRCSICGRQLDRKDSIERGIGPICAAKFGW